MGTPLRTVKKTWSSAKSQNSFCSRTWSST